MQIFVISLQNSTDRRNSITTQCERLGVKPVFIDAIYGKDFSSSDIEKYCDQEKAKQLFGRELLLGEIGCALSHKKVYQKVVNENIPYAIVLEDDALIKMQFSHVIEMIIGMQTDLDLVLLGHNKGFENGEEVNSIKSFWGNQVLDSNFKMARIAKGGLGTFGYIISNSGAKKLLEYLNFEKIMFPIDKITSNSKIINTYGLFPSIVTVDMKFDSMIENESLRNNDRKGELVFEIAKIVKKTPLFEFSQKLWFIALKVKPIRKYK